ncbi:rhodanese-like domain-containing protein [Gimesia panareensis]|uniref:Molybdopterin biosynthesis protein MoeB n=1 Tax=Gimesia panareensis TaxID=2527978 RepID=A0A518AGA3_9PLAN|nr:rhodanese-like domain-containing protein [Gimesia panareensis]QDT30711.1 molybdopterin biosynthesis protein MoeB [Gimesia panareensis]QDU53761.1 molybdopterin biosynthesis protein MoeB [Gimesia panareensis]QDV21661.1 molybdopterin biosynthesis protein MoeB [Gimesia panareensis]
MNHWKSYLLTLACAGLLVSAVNGADPTKDSLATVKKNLENKKAVLVDVRETDEWDEGHISGAKSLPLSVLSNGISPKTLTMKLSKKHIIYTHCAAGFRSCKAADVLLKHGYDVRPLKPGYDELVESGFKKAK